VVIFKKLFSSQLLTACFSFALLFAILIGFTCFNSGSMVRYKIPCLPFFCISIIISYYTAASPGLFSRRRDNFFSKRKGST
jgi:hypothetical protein